LYELIKGISPKNTFLLDYTPLKLGECPAISKNLKNLVESMLFLKASRSTFDDLFVDDLLFPFFKRCKGNFQNAFELMWRVMERENFFVDDFLEEKSKPIYFSTLLTAGEDLLQSKTFHIEQVIKTPVPKQELDGT
jgi:hypothetical protein